MITLETKTTIGSESRIESTCFSNPVLAKKELDGKVKACIDDSMNVTLNTKADAKHSFTASSYTKKEGEWIKVDVICWIK